MIFASLAHADECVHVNNAQDLPEAKLDSKIKAWEEKKDKKRKKDIAEIMHKTITLGCKLL